MSHRFSWQLAKDQATLLIAELEAELPPDVVAAAWERGQVLDLDTTVVKLRDELAEGGTIHLTENDHSPLRT